MSESPPAGEPSRKRRVRSLIDWVVVIAGPPIIIVGLPFLIIVGIPFLLDSIHMPKGLYIHIISMIRNGMMLPGILLITFSKIGPYFVEDPFRAFEVAFFLLFIYMPSLFIRKSQHKFIWPLGFPISAWIWYSAWEYSLVEKGYNIRIDLFLLYPPLFLATLIGFIVLLSDITRAIQRGKMR
jgi:hypothetical protein